MFEQRFYNNYIYRNGLIENKLKGFWRTKCLTKIKNRIQNNINIYDSIALLNQLYKHYPPPETPSSLKVRKYNIYTHNKTNALKPSQSVQNFYITKELLPQTDNNNILEKNLILNKIFKNKQEIKLYNELPFFFTTCNVALNKSLKEVVQDCIDLQEFKNNQIKKNKSNSLRKFSSSANNFLKNKIINVNLSYKKVKYTTKSKTKNKNIYNYITKKKHKLIDPDYNKMTLIGNNIYLDGKK